MLELIEDNPTEDRKVFGTQLIYCSQHMKVHTTGWCSVSVSDKLGLGTDDIHEAIEKCRKFKLPLYADSKPMI